MREYFDKNRRHEIEPSAGNQASGQVDWDRLEEIGDLHFHASAYSSCLDYYRQVLENSILHRMPLLRALGVLRKAIDANILLGQITQVQEYIYVAFDLIGQSPDAGADPDLAVQKAIFQVRMGVVHRERGQLQESLQISKSAFSMRD